MSDQKWPGNKSRWEDEYKEVRPELQTAGSPWAQAFKAVVEADRAGEFKYLKSLHDESVPESGLWVWRWALWEVHSKPIFDRPKEQWPPYAMTVYKSVPADQMDRDGHREGIPESWFEGTTGDRRKVWAFKNTVLLIAGLIEQKLLPNPDEVVRDVRRFVEDNASAPLKPEVRNIFDNLSNRFIFAR